LLVGLLIAAGHFALAGEPRVREKQAITELLGGKPGLAAAPTAAAAPAGAGIIIPGAWQAGTAGIGVALLAAVAVILRRRRARGTAPHEAGAVQVVGRALLSHRHAVFVLQVSGRRLVVGVAGDRMTALDAFEETATAAAERPEEPAALAAEPHRGYTVRPEDRQALRDRRELDASELRPYRKQMDRLRGMLRDMRGDGHDPGVDGA
jgi:flagellar biogenesis protein FliO